MSRNMGTVSRLKRRVCDQLRIPKVAKIRDNLIGPWTPRHVPIGSIPPTLADGVIVVDAQGRQRGSPGYPEKQSALTDAGADINVDRMRYAGAAPVFRRG